MIPLVMPCPITSPWLYPLSDIPIIPLVITAPPLQFMTLPGLDPSDLAALVAAMTAEGRGRDMEAGRIRGCHQPIGPKLVDIGCIGVGGWGFHDDSNGGSTYGG